MNDNLSFKIEQLERALDQGHDQLPPEGVTRGLDLLDRLKERVSFGPEHTVVALAGSTGSGKSSLMNALAGMEVAKPGVRRPTTKQPVSCQWGAESPELLDWLSVPLQYRTSRNTDLDHQVSSSFDGLVLLDLPDHDSHQVEHRLLVDELIEKVDLMVWVVDPQKYADDVLHRDYLAPLKEHQDVTVVVLNQIDRLAPGDVDKVLNDLRQTLAHSGLDRVQVFGTSARTGAGVIELQKLLRTTVGARNATWQRWGADITATAHALRAGVADREATLVESKPLAALVESLGDAAGVPSVCEAVENHYIKAATRHTGWPFTRWWSALKRDPLDKVGLYELDGGSPTTEVTALPEPSQVSAANVDRLRRQLVQEASTGLPAPWQQAIKSADSMDNNLLRDALDQAVLAVPITRPQPVWWKIFSTCQILLALSLIVGLGITVVQALAGWFSIQLFNEPVLGPIPLPPILVAFGLLGGVAFSIFGLYLSKWRATKHADQVREEIMDSIADMAHIKMARPLTNILEQHARTRDCLERVLAG